MHGVGLGWVRTFFVCCQRNVVLTYFEQPIARDVAIIGEV